MGIPSFDLAVLGEKGLIGIGEYETYKIRVTNEGDGASRNLRVVCHMEDTMEYVSVNGPTDAAVKDNQVRLGVLPRLESGGEVTWRVVIKAIGEGEQVRFKVNLTSDRVMTPLEKTVGSVFIGE